MGADFSLNAWGKPWIIPDWVNEGERRHQQFGSFNPRRFAVMIGNISNQFE